MQDSTQQETEGSAECRDLHLALRPAAEHHAMARRYLIARQRRLLSRSWSLKALRLGVGLMAVLGAIGLATFQPTSLEGARAAVRLSTVLLLGATVLFWIQTAWGQRILYRAEQEELRPFRVPYTLTMRADALVVSSPLGQSSLRWAAISRAEIAEGYLLITVAASDVLIIPPGCGASLEELKHRVDSHMATCRHVTPSNRAT